MVSVFVKKNIAVSETPSQSYGMSLAICDHTVLPATRHKWTHPALIPTRQAGTRFTYPGRDRRLSWPRWLVTYRDGLPAHRRSPVQVLTGPWIEQRGIYKKIR